MPEKGPPIESEGKGLPQTRHLRGSLTRGSRAVAVLDRAGIRTLAAAPAQANTARGCRRGSSGEGAATAMTRALDGDDAARGHRIQVV